MSGQPQANETKASELASRADWRWASFLEGWTLRHRDAVWLLIIAFYLLSVNGLWRIGPDSALYLSLGRSLARGEGYTYLGETHRLAYPGLPYMIAAAMKLSPTYAMLILDIAMVGITLAALALCEQLFRLMVRPGTAIVVTAMLCCSFRVYSKAFEVLTEAPFLLGTVMALLGGALSGIMPLKKVHPEAADPSKRGRIAGWFLLPAGLALCAVMRPAFYVLGATIALAVLLQLANRRTARHVAGAVVVVLLVGLTLWLITRSDPRRTETGQDIYEEAVSAYVQTAIHDPSVVLAHAHRIVTPELPTAFLGFWIALGGDYVLVALLLTATVWVLWRFPAALIFVALTLAQQLVVAPVPRYMTPILPLLVLSWWVAAVRISERIPSRQANIVTFGAYLLLFPNVCRCVGQVWYEQYRRPFLNYYDHGKYAALDEVNQVMRTLPADAVVLAPDSASRILGFMADRWCVPMEQPIPVHMRGRPLFVVHVEGDLANTAIAEQQLAIGEKLIVTRNGYGTSGRLALCRAALR